MSAAKNKAKANADYEALQDHVLKLSRRLYAAEIQGHKNQAELAILRSGSFVDRLRWLITGKPWWEVIVWEGDEY